MKKLLINWVSVFIVLLIIFMSYATLQASHIPFLTQISFSLIGSLILSLPITWAFTYSKKNKFAKKVNEVVDSAMNNLL